jgi:spoIIIJ-associated protein
MNTDHQEIITKLVEELVSGMGFQAKVRVVVSEDAPPSYLCSIEVGEGQNFLIGQYGMNLAALQHLVRIMARKKIGEKMDIIVDVNDYFLEKKELLEKEALQTLEEALQNNVSVAMRPMLPYERKVVHAFLAQNESVVTESVGIGEERKVIVKPRPLPAR